MNHVRGKVKSRAKSDPPRFSRWFRLYAEALHDPKIVTLSDRQFRSWVGILCVAAQNGGKLPSTRDIASHLRMTCPAADEQVNDLIEAGLIDIGRDGSKTPHNWDGRQFMSDTSTERVRRHRETARNGYETFHGTKRNVSASESVSEVCISSTVEQEETCYSSQDREIGSSLGGNGVVVGNGGRQ